MLEVGAIPQGDPGDPPRGDKSAQEAPPVAYIEAVALAVGLVVAIHLDDQAVIGIVTIIVLIAAGFAVFSGLQLLRESRRLRRLPQEADREADDREAEYRDGELIQVELDALPPDTWRSTNPRARASVALPIAGGRS